MSHKLAMLVSMKEILANQSPYNNEKDKMKGKKQQQGQPAYFFGEYKVVDKDKGKKHLKRSFEKFTHFLSPSIGYIHLVQLVAIKEIERRRTRKYR